MRIFTFYLVFISLFTLSFPSCAQKPLGHNSFTHSITIKKDLKLIFLSRENNGDLFFQPRIFTKGQLRKIDGYDENNFSGKQIHISPDKKYFVMDHISKGYVYTTSTDSVLSENYSCVIVSVEKLKVVEYLQSDCDGKWGNSNQWIKNGEVIFSP